MSKVPNLPPISGIQDPNVRAYLQALSSAWQVRNGDVGDGSEKFLTVSDLQQGVLIASRGNGSVTGAKGGKVAAAVAEAMQALSDQVQQSRLWKLLAERIERVEMPEWFRGKFGAEIVTEHIRQGSVNNAIAGQITTAVTNINNNIALVQGELEAVSDQAGATASSLTSLQTTVSGVSNTAQQALGLSQTIDGQVNGAWTVKFDANGYVTGAGLGLQGKNGSYSSEFMVRADRFVIGTPQYGGIPDYVPFVVQTTSTTVNGVTVPAGVYMADAFIKNASVDTLKLGKESVSVLRVYHLSTLPNGGGTWSGTITLPHAGKLVITTAFTLPSDFGNPCTSSIRVTVQGSVIFNEVQNAGSVVSFTLGGDELGAGTYTIGVNVYPQAGGNYPAGCVPRNSTLILQGDMR